MYFAVTVSIFLELIESECQVDIEARVMIVSIKAGVRWFSK